MVDGETSVFEDIEEKPIISTAPGNLLGKGVGRSKAKAMLSQAKQRRANTKQRAIEGSFDIEQRKAKRVRQARLKRLGKGAGDIGVGVVKRAVKFAPEGQILKRSKPALKGLFNPITFITQTAKRKR